MVLTYGIHIIPLAFRDRYYMILYTVDNGVHPYVNRHRRGSVPSLSGHVVVYRWRLPLRVRRHRVSSPQGVPVTGDPNSYGRRRGKREESRG